MICYVNRPLNLYYSLIRWLQPKLIVEVGSGHSTRLAALALQQNAAESASGDKGRMICVEPYRHPDWFPGLGVEHIQMPIEKVAQDLISELGPEDIFFIDSSHMLKPQGDVLYLILEVLAALPVGIHIHVHDIFSPLDYPNEWLIDGMQFWNEQYLLEAFLAFNPQFRVVAGIQYLLKQDSRRLESLLPRLADRVSDIATTSIWLQKIEAP